MSHRKKIVILAFVFMLLIVLYLTWGLKPLSWRYALSRRIPKTIAIVLTSFALSFSSVIFQTVTNNRILAPSVLGLDAVYMFLQTLIVFIFGMGTFQHINTFQNFALSTGAMLLFAAALYHLIFKRERANIYFMLLIGMIFSTFFQSMSSFMQMLIDPNEFSIVQNSMFASFNNVNTRLIGVSTGILTLSMLYAFSFAKQLDVMSLGRDHAINLGIPYEKVVKKMLIVVVLMVSIATSLIGPITFLGLLVVNLAREVLKTYKHVPLFLGSMLIGGIALIGGQMIVERVFNYHTPISVVINLVGGIYFIYLLLKERKS